MASSTALKTAYTTAVGHIDDTLLKAEATYLLDRWVEALDAQNAVEGGQIQSYTIAGRTVTKSSLGEGSKLIDRLRGQLQMMIYGSAILLDMNEEDSQPTGYE